MEDVLKWVCESVGGDAEVLEATPLVGGISSTIHRVKLRVDGEVRHVVLRQFTLKEWLEAQSDLAQHEAESLRWAGKTDVPAPRLIAIRETEVSAVLMTEVPGDVELKPANPEEWIRQMAQALARIHRESAEGFERSYFSYNDPMKLHVPEWSEQKDLWRAALDIAQGPRPETRTCLIHRDYHPTNVLWQDGQLSGVVDWVNTCRGPAGADVGHCRLNLALLRGLEEADLFLEEYQKAAGELYAYEPYWDLISLMDWLPNPPSVYRGWTDLGVTDPTAELMKERYERLLASIMDRHNLSQLLNEVIERKKGAKRLLIGIDGLSGSGKTTLAESVKTELVKHGLNVAAVHIDDLITERKKRYQTGFAEWHEHYHLQWDAPAIAKKLFQNWEQGAAELELDVYDSGTDSVSAQTLQVPADGILLIEGVFLQRQEWRGYFDYLAYIDCPRATRFERATTRGGQDPHDQARIALYERRYWAAEDYYLKTVVPSLRADSVLV